MMAANNFNNCLKLTLRFEGGYVDNIHDVGGQTNFGITQAVYNAWRHSHGQPIQSVRAIQMDEVTAIYKTQYWDAINGDALPEGVDMATFDLAVNSGPITAIKFLQRSVGVVADGHLGLLTMAAIQKTPAKTIIVKDCALRLSFLEKLKNWEWFGKGWRSRVGQVQVAALQMCGSLASPKAA